ncbi:MAG: ATP-binding protein [Candidatus Microsaccharimonas sp.]
MLNFEKLFVALGTPYIIFDASDPDCTILEENEAHAAIAMVNREDVIGKKLLDAFPDTSEQYKKTGKSELAESIRRVATTGKTEVMPVFGYDIKDRNGILKTKFWEVTHSPVFEGKKIVAVMQQSKDITQNVIAEKKLAQAQDQLAQALAYTAVGTWLWDIKNNVVLADKNSAKLFGLSNGEEAAEAPIEEFIKAIHPDDVKRVQKEISQAVKDRAAYESEYRLYDADGKLIWLLARGHVELDEKGNPSRFPGLVVDITERKQAERKLHVLSEANTQFPASYGAQQILETITSKLVPDLADWCAIDLLVDGEIQQVTVAHKDPKKIEWAKQLRVELDAVNFDAKTGAPWVIRTGKVEHVPIVTEEMLKEVAKTDSQLELLKSVGMTSIIIAPLKIDGKTIGAITLISTDSERHYGTSDVEIAHGLANRAALAIYNANLFKEAHDEIIERKRLQNELEDLNAALESRVEKRTEELEKTNAGLEREISRRQQVEAELNEYGKSLSRSNQELQDFAYVASHDLQEPLRKIRAFGDILQNEYSTELGSGSEYLIRMQNAAARMSTLIQDLLAFSRVTTREQVTEKVDLAQIVKEVIVDLEWRIQELDGTIKVNELPIIEADPTHMRQLFQNLISNALKFHQPGVPPVVEVLLCEESAPDVYTVCVKDNGIGFDERYLDRIFSVFQRLHGKNEYEGTGIGLAVVRKIVERYNGTITATSKKNVGSTFKMSFPKALEETA